MPHPTIVSESGRAIVAHHSLLVFNVLGVSGFGDERRSRQTPTPDMEQPLVDLIETYDSLTSRNALESYHDAQQALDMAMNLFSGGYLPLEQRSHGREPLLGDLPQAAEARARRMDEVPEDLQSLDESLSDTYFCNFSLFQSIPDSWAIKQLFPIMPIHRLNERPTRHAVLGDITCDSDGKIDQFIDRRDVKRTLPLHSFDGSPYYLGVFLVGAYQEILGDLHNLLGDTHAVHVSLDENDAVVLDAVIKGDTVREVLDYVEFDAEALVDQAAHRRRSRRPRGPARLRGVRPPAALLRRRAAGLHLPRGTCDSVKSPLRSYPTRRSRHVCGLSFGVAPAVSPQLHALDAAAATCSSSPTSSSGASAPPHPLGSNRMNLERCLS